MQQELVKDWMSTDVISVTPDASLADADQLMITHVIRRLPVLEEDGTLLGIVTYGDIRSARPSRASTLHMWELESMAAHLKVAEFMTTRPLTIQENATIGKAAQLMLNNMISGLPVLNKAGELVGIITESDIFRLVAKNWARRATAV